MKNLKKLKKEELKKVLGGIDACSFQLCYRNGKWICVPFDTCGGFQP
ncbi:MAG: hypothetical protein MUW56_16180 [Chryseobacterium sp.]|nr:hypothetical protein [Chryseobacterium sp.]MCJ7935111.1 hypothetical protein [Chryseobacterium sp.]